MSHVCQSFTAYQPASLFISVSCDPPHLHFTPWGCLSPRVRFCLSPSPGRAACTCSSSLTTMQPAACACCSWLSLSPSAWHGPTVSDSPLGPDPGTRLCPGLSDKGDTTAYNHLPWPNLKKKKISRIRNGPQEVVLCTLLMMAAPSPPWGTISRLIQSFSAFNNLDHQKVPALAQAEFCPLLFMSVKSRQESAPRGDQRRHPPRLFFALPGRCGPCPDASDARRSFLPLPPLLRGRSWALL